MRGRILPVSRIHTTSGGIRRANRVLGPDGPHGGSSGEACIQDSTLLLGHLGSLLAGLREADGDGLLRIGDLLLRLPALERAFLLLVHCLLDLFLRLGTVFRHGSFSSGLSKEPACGYTRK